jgi:glycosyltransferase involved in cell wall biosynthesis
VNTEEYIMKYTRDAVGRYWPFIAQPCAARCKAELDLYPRITVVTPSYNQAQFLEETICSVIAQDYPRFEYIVMDGGSTDGSREIIGRYAPWIESWTSEKDGGQADAIHKGFQKATGDILCWLNSDDVFLPGALWRAAEFFKHHPTVDCAVGGVLWIDADGRLLFDHWGVPLAKIPVANTFGRLLHWGQYACPQMSTFWRSTAYWKVGGLDAKMQLCMDRDLFVRLAAEKPFGCIPYFLSCYRYHAVSKSATAQSIRVEEDDVIARHYGPGSVWPLRRYLSKGYYSSDVLLRRWWLRLTWHAGLWRLPKALRPSEGA